MRNKIILLLWMLFPAYVMNAQQPGPRHIRIVDTMTIQEKSGRNPILLRSELDSLVKLYAPVQVSSPKQEPIMQEKTDHLSGYILPALGVIFLLLGWILVSFYRHQRKISRAMGVLPQRMERTVISALPAKEKNNRGKITVQSLEAKIGQLDADLLRLSKENEGLNRVLKEYNGIRQEYESLRRGLRKVYKVKNYPGYDKTKDDGEAIQGVLETENSVANYAYEKFLKPILLITDANKNNPAKMTAADRDRLLDLLISLSLLYIEYLYLRVSDLSIGGNMVERIQAIARGKGPDPSLLKRLDTEFGSRALVIRMALNKTTLQHLSYPVFDETDLNHQ